MPTTDEYQQFSPSLANHYSGIAKRLGDFTAQVPSNRKAIDSSISKTAGTSDIINPSFAPPDADYFRAAGDAATAPLGTTQNPATGIDLTGAKTGGTSDETSKDSGGPDSTRDKLKGPSSWAANASAIGGLAIGAYEALNNRKLQKEQIKGLKQNRRIAAENQQRKRNLSANWSAAWQ